MQLTNERGDVDAIENVSGQDDEGGAVARSPRLGRRCRHSRVARDSKTTALRPGIAGACRGDGQRYRCRPKWPSALVRAPEPVGAIIAPEVRMPTTTATSAALQARFGEELGRLHAMVETLSRHGRIDHLVPDLPAPLDSGLLAID